VDKATGKLDNARGEIDIDYRHAYNLFNGHFTYDNSRVIKNYNSHVEKFGNPGFSMKEMMVQKH
jgi:hypothetical protein